MAITVSNPNNITSPIGNALAIFKDSSTNNFFVVDINGKTESLERALGQENLQEVLDIGNSALQDMTVNGKITFGESNTNSGTRSFIAGSSNTISSGNNFVIGNSNTNSGVEGIVIGSSNSLTANSTTSVLIGKGNNSNANENVYLIGNLLDAQDNSNTFFLGNTIDAGTNSNSYALGQNLDQFNSDSFQLHLGEFSLDETRAGCLQKITIGVGTDVLNKENGLVIWKETTSPFSNIFDITGKLSLNNYGSGNITGTATYRLGVDVSGNVIEVSDGGGTVSAIATTSPITGGTITTAGTIGITQSSTSTDGYLSSTDWNTFNNKVSGSGAINTIPLWGNTNALTNSILSQTTPYIGVNTGILDINGTLKQSGTLKSIYIGEDVGQSVNPTSAFLDMYNIGIGDDVLKNFVKGVDNSGASETSGENIGIGYQSLTDLTFGTNNLSIGSFALSNLTLGANNIAFGKNALLTLSGTRADSVGNVAIGFNTLTSMVTGTFNVAIGNTNFEAINTANSIVSIGNDIAKPFTGTASNLVMIGNKVLANTTATSITDGILIGQNSGLATSGTLSNDILIGRSVFQNNNSSGNNIAIGGNSNQNAGTISTSISIATRNGSGTGGSAGSYGIVISTYDDADVGVGSVNNSTGKYSSIIGGIGNLNQGGNGFIGGGKTNIIDSTATNSAILGGFDNEVQSGGSGGMALGSNLQVNGNNQVVLGRFNTPNNNTKLIVGCGFSNANRRNGFEVFNTGQLRASLYGGGNFQATGSYNFLVAGTTGNILEVDSSLITDPDLSITNVTAQAGAVFFVSSTPTDALRVSWSGVAGTSTIRLPAIFPTNRTLYIFTTSSFGSGTSNIISIESATGELIDGNSTLTLNTQFKSIKLYYDGSSYQTISTN